MVTGDVYDFDTTSSETVFALSDGWCKYDYRKGRFTILSPTGEERESFDGEYPEDVSAAPTLDHPLMSAAELKSLIQDEDVSWAKIKITRAKNSSSSCSTKLTIGESTFKPANESGECYEPDGIVLYALSSDNSVLMRASTDPTSTSTNLPSLQILQNHPGDSVHLSTTALRHLPQIPNPPKHNLFFRRAPRRLC